MKYLIILRGIPGAGKSTCANVLSENAYPIFSADDFFIVDGEYVFNADKLHQAHAQCKHNTEQAMIDNIEKIFVANTNTTKTEMKSYFELAAKYEYMVISLIVENRHGNLSIHNVPNETLIKMKNRFDIQL